MYPIGATVLPGNEGVHFRVWAPQHRRVEVTFVGNHPGRYQEKPPPFQLKPEKEGFFSGVIPTVPLHTLYGFRLDGCEKVLPDPASRFQPHGTGGLSQIIDSSSYFWRDQHWRGIKKEGNVLYEMHIGTFTEAGTWETATREIEELAHLGITVIELMPVAEFEGKFNWGYDGVFQFAPTHLYGTPDEFRKFVDTAHTAGIGVILDVVYNHLGPGGTIFKEFSPWYFTDKHTNEWGEAINFDDQNSGPVREYFISNAHYWIESFHLDGLRIDATQQIFDASEINIMKEISDEIKAAAKERTTFLVGENEPQHAELIRTYGFDSLWNDDFHRTAMVALTGHAEAYFSDYKGTPQEFVSAAKYGYLYQGQFYSWQGKERGSPAFDLRAEQFISYLQNHDQIANSCRGQRVHHLADPGRYRALTTLLLLGPQTPMLFQGQEFSASSPFYYFTDTSSVQSGRAEAGRKNFLSQFQSIKSVIGPLVPTPGDPASFTCCKLLVEERSLHSSAYKLHKDLLRIRRDEPVLRSSERKCLDGAVLGQDCFVLRYFGHKSSLDRILVINLGRAIQLSPNPEPLMAPPSRQKWKLLWYSEAPLYGGNGSPPLFKEKKWNIDGHAAFFLGPV